VTFSEVEGMSELNGLQCRVKNCKVRLCRASLAAACSRPCPLPIEVHDLLQVAICSVFWPLADTHG
jgi:hypothetical protein